MSLLLTGPQLGELARLVRGAFTVDEIDRELLFQLDRELNDIVGPGKGPPDTLVRFDLYEAPGGTTAGVPCPLAEKGWLLDALPPSALDEQRDPKPDPAADELDYALLKLNEPIADRTCLEPVEEALDIGDPLHILHYPGTGPLRLSLDTRAVTR